MRTLGQMADKGYFNPNLIKNAYHDPPKAKPGEQQSEGRAWVWSPNMLLPSRDNTGKEDQQLANAKWSNFCVGGLADPDEFRHISDLQSTEFAKILNDKVIAGEMSGKPDELGRLLPAFMIGRMIHESLVFATRRLVDQGAFDPGTPPPRKQELVEAFKAGVKQGVEAFAAEFTGREPGDVVKALKANGLDLDATLDGLVREREALHSYAYTDAFRANDAAYFAGVFGVDKDVIEFRAPDNESWRNPGEHVPLKDVMAGPDPVGWLMQNQVMGFTTVVAVDPNGKAVAAGDLGWVANNLKDHGGIFADDTAGVGKVDISDTPTQGRVVTVQVDPGFRFDDYLGGLRSRAHELQNAGGFNGAYFHQNEQHLNHILSSTLVDLRTAD